MPAHQGKFVAYFRVSTDRQGKSGLGLEAQRKSVLDYLNGGRWELTAEFTEVESLPLKHVRLGSITGISDVIGAFGRCQALEERRRMPALPGGSTVRSAALRSSVLNLAKTCSIGLRSGL